MLYFLFFHANIYLDELNFDIIKNIYTCLSSLGYKFDSMYLVSLNGVLSAAKLKILTIVNQQNLYNTEVQFFAVGYNNRAFKIKNFNS